MSSRDPIATARRIGGVDRLTSAYWALGLAGIVLVAALFIEVPSVSAATGQVASASGFSRITMPVTETIRTVEYLNGQLVEAGQTLLTLETTELQQELARVRDAVQLLDEQHERLRRDASVVEGTGRNNRNASTIGEIVSPYLRGMIARLLIYESSAAFAESQLQAESELPPYWKDERKINQLHHEIQILTLDATRQHSEAIAWIAEQKDSLTESRLELENRRREIERQIALRTVKASVAGQVQVVYHATAGDYVPGGTEIVRVLPTQITDIVIFTRLGPATAARIRSGDAAVVTVVGATNRSESSASGVVESVFTVPSESGSSVSPGWAANVVLNRNSSTAQTQFPLGTLCDLKIVSDVRPLIVIFMELMGVSTR